MYSFLNDLMCLFILLQSEKNKKKENTETNT